MKTKNLVLSLIFPMICFLCAIILLLLSLMGEPSFLRVILGVFCAAAGLFPLIAVIFAKTDISSVTKWQAMFTAAAAVPILIYAVLSGFVYDLPYFLNVLFMIVIPLAFTVAAGITYGKIFHREDSAAVLKWFTAFLSTPILWYFLFMVIIGTAITEKPFGLGYSHVG